MLDILYNRASTKQATPIDVLFFGRFIDRSSSTVGHYPRGRVPQIGFGLEKTLYA